VKEKRCSLGLFCLALFIAYDPAFAQQEIEKGKPPYQAILDGGGSKLRPILLIVVTSAGPIILTACLLPSMISKICLAKKTSSSSRCLLFFPDANAALVKFN